MATNTFYNIADITKMSMEVLENNLVLAKHVNRGYDDRFRDTGGQIGDTANIRIPGYYTVRSGKAASPQGFNETYKSVTLTQKGVDVQFSSKELTLNVDDFKNNVLAPMIAPLANQVDADGFDLYSSVPNYVGIAGTAPTDLSAVLDAGAMLDEYAVPRDDGGRFAIFAPRQMSSIVNGLKTLFNPTKDIAEQYKSGNLGELSAGFKCSVDQNCPTHTTGTFGTSTPEIDSTTADGATTLRIDGWASGASTLNAGDIIAIQGVYSVNPVSKRSTGQLKQFVVTAQTSDSGGTMAALPVSPALILTGPNQNISALPVNNADVYVFGAQANTYSNKTTTTGFVGHKNGLVLASADLKNVGPADMCSRVKSKRLNMSIRMVKFYNGMSDDELYRLDILYGWSLLRDNHLVRLHG